MPQKLKRKRYNGDDNAINFKLFLKKRFKGKKRMLFNYIINTLALDLSQLAIYIFYINFKE